jgi:hypothetical protein
VRSTSAQWTSEHIPADDPFARFAAMAQRILVRRVIAANRTHWRKYDEQQARKRAGRELALRPVLQAPQQTDATR